MRVFILTLFFSTAAFSQGPVDGFFKGRGNLDLALSGAYQHSGKFYDGIAAFNYTRNLYSLSLYGEYGVTDSWDVIGNVPFINGQFQDASVFVKHRIGVPFSFGVFSLIPAAGISFPLSNYQTEASQSIGQRATQFQPKLVMQLDGLKGLFFQIQGGYNLALNPVPSSIPVSAKIGIYRQKFYADAWFDYQKGVGGKAWHVDPISSFRELFVTYAKIGGAFYYGFKPKYGVFVNGSYILTGVNIGKAYTVGAGFVYKFGLVQ
ncbi:MAG: hypothetical protein HYZ14_15480 [Bacteroidetes bacterium]|nr:hypothetical protein [Bacteroidota bacterium]